MSMIKRMYVDNFRCLTNFEFKVGEDKNALFLGENGAGKSSLLKILSILKKIARGNNGLADKDKLTKQDYGFAGTKKPIVFEIDIEISQRLFTYGIWIDYPETFFKPRIKKEQLFVDGKACFTRNLADISVGKAVFSLDWHIAALPIIQAHPSDPVNIFRDWLKNMLLMAPVPAQIKGETDDNDDVALDFCASNFVSWLSSILGQYPHLYGNIAQYIKEFLPDFGHFIFFDVGKDSRELKLIFEKNGGDFSIPFEKLSDGEKLLFLSGAVFAIAQSRKNVFCFWDEPNNYISVSLLDGFIRKMLNCFKQNDGQLWVVSHNIEIISGFNDDNSWIFHRNGHTDATLPLQTIAEFRKTKNFTGSLATALLTGDIYDAE